MEHKKTGGAMRETILSAKKLEKKFRDTAVLHGIDLDLYTGDFTVIMGVSGAKKSTLLYCLSGMDTVSGGQLFFREKPLAGAGEKELTRLRANAFGFVFQNTQMVSDLTLYENVVLAGFLGKASQQETRRRADALLEQMNLGEAKNRLPSQVSGGEAQRAAVARAVIKEADILFADEPTGALNRANTDEVLALMTLLNAAGQTILMVTHDRNAALRGNRILYLEDGSITGELRLPPYAGGDPQREGELNQWLAQAGW